MGVHVSMKFVITLLTAILMLISVAMAGETVDFSVEPTLNNGEKWRIGYYEGGEYYDYKGWFLATIVGLMEFGWINKADIPVNDGESTDHLWRWLTTDMSSKYLEFVPDAHYSAKWSETVRTKLVPMIINRLNEKNDIDMMLAFGTWAGKDLANNKHHVPTLVISASDAVGSGIVKDIHYSGYDHVHAHMDPFLYERQVLIFYDVIKFKTLGMAYENSVNGKSYAALATTERIAHEKDFEVITCYTQSDIPDKKVAGQSVIQCMQELCDKGAEAIYVTQQGGVNINTLPFIVKIVNKYNIPTFSQAGPQEVKEGIFMSISNSGFKYVGEFHAEIIAKVFNGAKPGELDQLFEGPPKVAINIDTAKNIGFDPPMLLFGATDEIYK